MSRYGGQFFEELKSSLEAHSETRRRLFVLSRKAVASSLHRNLVVAPRAFGGQSRGLHSIYSVARLTNYTFAIGFALR